MSTFWLSLSENQVGDETTTGSSWAFDDILNLYSTTTEPESETLPLKTIRLVDWNTDTLCQALVKKGSTPVKQKAFRDEELQNAWFSAAMAGRNILSEVKEVLDFPRDSLLDKEALLVDVDDEVREQLRSFVLAIASRYSTHAFHNFEVRFCENERFSILLF